MGNLMLAFTIFWAYIGFSQYMLIWYSNIPEETVYFLRRNTASWWYLSQIPSHRAFLRAFPFPAFSNGERERLPSFAAWRFGFFSCTSWTSISWCCLRCT